MKKTTIDQFDELHKAIINFLKEIGIEKVVIKLNNFIVKLKEKYAKK